MIINMRRQALQHLNITDCQHAGLLLERGFKQWNNSSEEHNSAITELHQTAAEITSSDLELYKKAYQDWKQYHIENADNSKTWFGELENRLFLGMGEASPLEAGITLHHTYGVPFIPGSAIKGVLRHYAHKIKLNQSIQHILFGKETNPNNKEENGEAGYIIFNDAWWVPEGKALVPEIITVHAQQYYNKGGKNTPHPDFESPNPNPQIAIQGSFMFTVEGDEKWAEYAIKLLQQALSNQGIGAKGSSGYGYFEKPITENEKAAKKWLEKTLNEVKKSHNIAENKEAYASKPMAEEWNKIDNPELKQKILNSLQEIWQDKERYPSKKAQKLYNS